MTVRRLDALVTRVLGRGVGAWVGVEDLGSGALGMTGDHGTPADPRAPGDGTPFAPGDLLVSRVRPELRKLALARRVGVCSPELWVLRPREGVDPRAVLYALASAEVTAAWTAVAGGTGIPRVPWSFAAATPLRLPTPEDLACLAALDDAVAARLHVVAAAGRLLRALASAALGEPPPALAEPPPALAAHAVEIRALVQAGRAPADTPCVGLEHLSRGGLALSGWGRFGDARSEKVWFEPGDLLVGRLRPALHKLALAPVAGLASPDILVLRARSPSARAVVAGALLLPEVPVRLDARGRGTHMPRVRAADVLSLPAPLLPEIASAACAHALDAAGLAHALRRVRDLHLRRIPWTHPPPSAAAPPRRSRTL